MRRFAFSLLFSALLLSACGGSSSDAHRYHDMGRDYTVRVPHGWRLASKPLTPHLVSPKEILSLGTFPLRVERGGCAQMPQRAVEDMRQDDALVSIQEYKRFDPQDFPPRPNHFRQRPGAYECITRPGFHSSFLRFSEGHRSFYAVLVIGPRGPEAQALGVLDSFRAQAPSSEDRKGPEFRDPALGIKVKSPSGWHIRHAQFPARALRLDLVAASFRLPDVRALSLCPPNIGSGRSRGPQVVTGRVPRGTALVAIDEYPSRTFRQRMKGFPPRPNHFHLGRWRRYECGEGWNMVFRDHGRALQAQVWAYPHAFSQQRRAEVERFLDSLRFARQRRFPTANVPSDKVRRRVIFGAKRDFRNAVHVPPGFESCVLPRFRHALSRGRLGILRRIYVHHDQPKAAQALNDLAAPLADRCGGRRWMPELVAASKGLAPLGVHAARDQGAPIGVGSRTLTCADLPFIGSATARWRRQASSAGPFGLSGSGRDFRRGALSADGLYRTKTPAIVEGHRAVELIVPASERDQMGFDLVSRGGPYARVKFVPCSDKPRTIWAAGLVLRDRSPVVLDVRVAGVSVGAIHIGRLPRR